MSLFESCGADLVDFGEDLKSMSRSWGFCLFSSILLLSQICVCCPPMTDAIQRTGPPLEIWGQAPSLGTDTSYSTSREGRLALLFGTHSHPYDGKASRKKGSIWCFCNLIGALDMLAAGHQGSILRLCFSSCLSAFKSVVVGSGPIQSSYHDPKFLMRIPCVILGDRLEGSHGALRGSGHLGHPAELPRRLSTLAPTFTSRGLGSQFSVCVTRGHLCRGSLQSLS